MRKDTEKRLKKRLKANRRTSQRIAKKPTPPEVKFKRRIWVLGGICFLIAGVIIGRSVQVQILGDPRLEKLASRQFHVKVLDRPKRGPILDRNGKSLAVNVDTYSLAANPSKISKKLRGKVARTLARVTGVSRRKIKKKLASKRSFVWIKRHLSDSKIQKLRSRWVDGIWLIKETKRVYPQGSVAAHILGDVNVDSQGLEGLELKYDKELKGKETSFRTTKDALGRKTFIDAAAISHLEQGKALSLTIDSTLQFEVEQILHQFIEKTGSRSGSVIIMNADSGELHAVANFPTFDPNHPVVKPSHRRNRAFTDGYEPGSTIKPLLMMSALSNGWRVDDRVWGEKGRFRVQGITLSEAEAGEGFEWLTLEEIIKYSSNIGAAKVSMRLEAGRYLHTLKQLGLGRKTGSGFPGEISGKLPRPRKMRPIKLANIGFGQGLLVTPIQMVRAFAAILNGGKLVRPHLVRGQAELEPKAVVDLSVARRTLEAMRSVTQPGGTGDAARIEGYQIAGKTGTSQIIDPKTRRYSESRYIPTFIGFAINVNPKLVIYTLLDGPQGKYYSSHTAVPLFREVLRTVTNRYAIPKINVPDLPTPLLAYYPGSEQTQKDRVSSSQAQVVRPRVGTRVQKLSLQNEIRPLERWSIEGESESGELSKMWKMPSLQGLTLREALGQLRGYPFQVKLEGSGFVLDQKPQPGEKIASGETVEIFLKSESEAEVGRSPGV